MEYQPAPILTHCLARFVADMKLDERLAQQVASYLEIQADGGDSPSAFVIDALDRLVNDLRAERHLSMAKYYQNKSDKRADGGGV